MMTEEQEVRGDKRQQAPIRPFYWPLCVQIIAYVVLIALACLPGSGIATNSTFAFTTFAVAVMIMVFAFFAPLRDGIPGRIVAVVLGFIAMIFASTPFLGEMVFTIQANKGNVIEHPQYLSASAWFAGVASLLVILVVVAFIRQMARAKRTNMLVQLSHMVVDGVVSIAASGWCCLPMLFHEAQQPDVWRIACLVLVVVGAIALGAVSRLWYQDSQLLASAHSPWIGFGLMPVMITGALIGIAALIMWLV